MAPVLPPHLLLLLFLLHLCIHFLALTGLLLILLPPPCRGKRCPLLAHSHHGLLGRCAALGFSPVQLHGALKFIELSAPLVVHVTTPALEALGAGAGQDFTGAQAGGGGAGSGAAAAAQRAAREAALFDGAYSGEEQGDRPAYGALSVTGDSRGVACAAESFGRHYLMLRPSTTRSRVTLACSGAAAGSAVGTLAHCAHMLEQYSEAELAGVLAVGAGEAEAQVFGRDCAAGAVFQEVQVHGALRVAEDVEAVVVMEEEARPGSAARSAAERFAARYGCSLVVVPAPHRAQ